MWRYDFKTNTGFIKYIIKPVPALFITLTNPLLCYRKTLFKQHTRVFILVIFNIYGAFSPSTRCMLGLVSYILRAV